MGCGESKFDSVYTYFPLVGMDSAYFDALLLNECEVGQLYSIFLKLVSSGGSKASVDHICNFMNIDANLFIRKVLGLGECDLVSFPAFVIGFWNFCTADKNCFGKLIFYTILLSY